MNLLIPTLAAKRYTISEDAQKLWKGAVWNVRQGQVKFLEAYRKTLDELIPGWEGSWKNDPNFSVALGEVEKYIHDICKANGMTNTVFNKYRGAARKSCLMNVKFDFAFSNFTMRQLREICQGGEEKANEIRRSKNIKSAIGLLTNKATVLPLPVEGEHQDDYLENVKGLLAAHIQAVREKYGEDAARKLLEGVA